MDALAKDSFDMDISAKDVSAKSERREREKMLLLTN